MYCNISFDHDKVHLLVRISRLVVFTSCDVLIVRSKKFFHLLVMALGRHNLLLLGVSFQ